MRYEITIKGALRRVDVHIEPDGRYRVRWEGEDHVVDVLRPSAEAFQMLIDGESWEAGCVRTDDGYLVDILGASIDVAVVDPRRQPLRLSAKAGEGVVSTQMPGRIARVLVKVGDVVRKGQALLVVEAMKMENELRSPIDGVVSDVLVVDGQSVETGARLVRIRDGES